MDFLSVVGKLGGDSLLVLPKRSSRRLEVSYVGLIVLIGNFLFKLLKVGDASKNSPGVICEAKRGGVSGIRISAMLLVMIKESE
jgi:hypothetical protein